MSYEKITSSIYTLNKRVIYSLFQVHLEGRMKDLEILGLRKK